MSALCVFDLTKLLIQLHNFWVPSTSINEVVQQNKLHISHFNTPLTSYIIISIILQK